MGAPVTFGSQEFLALPRKQQNEVVFKLLSPLARVDFEREIQWLRAKRDEVWQRVALLEKVTGSVVPSPPINKPNHAGFKTTDAYSPIVPLASDGQEGHMSISPSFGTSTYHTLDSHHMEGDMDMEGRQGSWPVSYSSPPAQSQENIPDMLRRSRQQNKKVILNVGGKKHEVMWRVLEKQPRSRLGLLSQATQQSQILELCDAFSVEKNEYYFDRHPRTFNNILNFYRTGKLHVMDELCVIDFSQDLDYWMIDDLYLEACCEPKYSAKKEHSINETKKNSRVKDVVEVDEDFGNGPCARYQKCLWNLMEKPQSSVFAKLVSIFSISLVLISTLCMCMNTMPEFKKLDLEGKPTIENPIFSLVEAICISWFTIEYFLRLAGAPEKLEFLKGPLNIVDILAIAPYYLSLALVEQESLLPLEATEMPALAETTSPTPLNPEDEGANFDDMSRIIQVFRIARIMRIFKLARSSTGLQAIAHTMQSSYKELSLLLLFVGMGMLIFGSLCYFVEKDTENSSYTSIPESMWWAIQTMTSVGYGDLCPITILGKLVGSACGVSGVLVMALPIPIVVENFGSYYLEMKKREVVTAKKKLLEERQRQDKASGQVQRERLAQLLKGDPGPFKTMPESPIHMADSGIDIQPLTNGQI